MLDSCNNNRMNSSTQCKQNLQKGMMSNLSSGNICVCEREREREGRVLKKQRFHSLSSHRSSSLFWLYSRHYRHTGMSYKKTFEFVDWSSQMVVLLYIQFHASPACTFNYRMCYEL